MTLRAVIFDLDGVIVSTDELHYRAWKRLADEEGICFGREANQRLRGVSRMASLEIVLERTEREYSPDERAELAARKNGYYRGLLGRLGPGDVLPGAMELLEELKTRGVKVAVASSSRNAPTILERIGLDGYFDATADGNDVTRSKPDPQVFLLAAERLGLPPEECIVVEDAEAGVGAALAGGMKVLGIGYAAGDERATGTAPDLASLTADELLAI